MSADVVPVPRDIAEACLYVIDAEIERRTRYGHPIPGMLREIRTQLTRALSAPGHQTCQTPTRAERFETARQRADRLGVTPRTVRRRAQASGARRVGHQWIFDRSTTP